MIPKSLFILILVLATLVGTQPIFGSTIPAGTVFSVRLLNPVSSKDSPGRVFHAELQHNITVGGKIALAGGTKFSGKVITSRRLTSSPHDLTVDLVAVQVNGQNVPLTTTGPQTLSNNVTTMGGVGISRNSYTVASGKRMQFKLARPLAL
jgi:hypothetical protein